LPSEIGKNENDELFELISSYFPKLDENDVSSILNGFKHLSKIELKTPLEPGTKVLKKGTRVLMAYLRVAPSVYSLIKDDAYTKWFSISMEVLELNIFSFEGFLDASPTIIKKGGLQLLEKWACIGSSIAQDNKRIAMAYFKNCGSVIVSTELEKFWELVLIGKDLAKLDIRVGESYFEYLPGLADLLSPEEFRSFFLVLKNIHHKDWTVAVEILAKSKTVFSAIPPGQKKTVLNSMNLTLQHSEKLTLALFINFPEAMTILKDRDLDEWTIIASKIAKIDKTAAISFLDHSTEVLDSIEMKEIEEWVDKSIHIFGTDRQAFQAFIHSSFKGLGKHATKTLKEERSYLLDMGSRLTDINPDCVESYFEHSPEALKILSRDKFNDWIYVGEEISRNVSGFGSGYYRNSVFVFKRINATFHGDILKTADMLLEKDWLLAGIFFNTLPSVIEKLDISQIKEWAEIGAKVCEQDVKLAVDFFSSSPLLMSDLDISELEQWALNGILISEDNLPLGRSYFSLSSRSSKDTIAKLSGSVALKKVSNVLRYYGLGLSGVNFSIRSRKALSIKDEKDDIYPIIEGKKIYLAPKMSVYNDFEDNFKIYKLSVMHEVGHAKFSSTVFSVNDSSELMKKMKQSYPQEQYAKMSDVSQDIIDVSYLISMFPNPILASTLFGLLEDARVEYMIMDQYKGVHRQLERIRHEMLLARPVPEDDLEKFMDALLWISAGNKPDFKIMGTNMSILDKASMLLRERLFRHGSQTLDSLDVAFEIYEMLDENFGPLKARKYKMLKNLDYRGVGIGVYRPKAVTSSPASSSIDTLIRNFIPETQPEIRSEEKKTHKEEKEPSTYTMEKDLKILGSYKYDEWDFAINDYKSDWCTVNEIEPTGGNDDYYVAASKRYSNEIALIKSIFSIMKPKEFYKQKQQTDGTEIDIDALIDSIIQKKCGINPDDGIYVRWDKKERDVATLFLVDVSASTKKVLGNEGRTIMDVEKDALIIMIQALESIGDKYAINAFSGHKREGVEYFIIKDFEEEISHKVARRIGLLEPTSNTRLGPAIRHSITKLEKIKAQTRMIILLSDGEPYDTCKGEGAYQGQLAEEDTRMAIKEGDAKGMHFFCITVDSNPGEYLDRIFSDGAYTIIDDAQMLPETLPVLYKKITT